MLKLYKDFVVQGNVKKARLYATALGMYEAEINGEPVDDTYFHPGWTTPAVPDLRRNAAQRQKTSGADTGGRLVAQCVNFPMQRNITFKSKGNVWYQIAWYVVAFVLITIVCSFLMGIYVPLCKQFFPPALYNVLITVINGGVQMVIYFPIYKIIFPEGEQN